MVKFNFYMVFHLEAKSQKSINNILNKISTIVTDELSLRIINIENTMFYVEKEYLQWENCIYGIIELSQKIGKQWLITDDINFRINLWTNSPLLIGVKAMEINGN